MQQTQAVARVPFMDLLRNETREVVLGMGCRYIEGVVFNIYGVFVITYLVVSLNVPKATALLGVTLAAVVMLFFIPTFGKLSDRLGRRRVFAWGAFLSGLAGFPAFWLMSTGAPSAVLIAIAIVIPFGFIYAAVYGPEAALFSELFDTRVRYSGISFVYQFSGIFASGLTPIIATALLRQGDGQPWLVAGYMLIVGTDQHGVGADAEGVAARRSDRADGRLRGEETQRLMRAAPGIGAGASATLIRRPALQWT